MERVRLERLRERLLIHPKLLLCSGISEISEKTSGPLDRIPSHLHASEVLIGVGRPEGYWYVAC
jgi:hypothetical protein